MIDAPIVRIRFREQPQATLRAKCYTLSKTDLYLWWRCEQVLTRKGF